jgi:hypothetical protein
MNIDKLTYVPTSYSFEKEREEVILNFDIVFDMKSIYHIYIYKTFRKYSISIPC